MMRRSSAAATATAFLIILHSAALSHSYHAPLATFLPARQRSVGISRNLRSSLVRKHHAIRSDGNRRRDFMKFETKANRISKSESLLPLSMSLGEGETEDYAKADDGSALQALFSKQCDKDGLMTKGNLISLPVISELLSDGDLLPEEVDDIWNAAPKFPQVDDAVVEERIDVDSFIQIYRDIDDIFENDDEDESPETTTSEASSSDEDAGSSSPGGDSAVGNDSEDDRDEQELEVAFKTICDDAGLVSNEALKEWNEIKELIKEGMLGEDEFDEIWDRTSKSPGSENQLDVDGFLSFNVALDDLFVFDEEEDDDANEDIGESKVANALTKPMFYGEDLPSGVIFSEIADDDFLVGAAELKRWGELQDMLNDGELLPIELQNFIDQIPTAPGTSDKMNEEGFTQLYEAIYELFEEDADEDDAQSDTPALKPILLSLLNKMNSDEEVMPCGLESLESEMQSVLHVITQLESEPSNIVISSGGDILPSDVAGEWDLLYTSSSTMKFNKGLSGLVPPNGKFGGLTQKLKASKYLADVEYIEKINAGPASFEVQVTGDWELKNSISLFTGARSVALSVEPDKVAYGPTTTRADHWKSLGPMNLLDITYLDEDIRIMRGTTSTDTVFVFKRKT